MLPFLWTRNLSLDVLSQFRKGWRARSWQRAYFL
jgi:hypothetical protein